MEHLLTLADLSPREIQNILGVARGLRDEWQEGGNEPLLAGKALGMLFQKPSLRTRVSFERAMQQLGGTALYLSPNEVQLGQRESIPDVARVLSRYVDGIMARVFGHDDIVQLAAFASVPVINGLSDKYHPCQALGDFLTIWDAKGCFENINIAFIGDGNNVAHSLMLAAAKLGANFTIGCPSGYEPAGDVLELAEETAALTGARISVVHEAAEAARDADVLYTDVWTSMGQEAEAEKRRAVFRPYQVNSSLLAKARPDAIVMHCLPAHRGEEITDDVADGPQSVIFDQAENRLHAQKAVLALLLQHKS